MTDDLQQSIFASAAPEVDPDATAYELLAKLGREKLVAGHTATREEIKAMREVDMAVAARAQTMWPDRPAAAEALDITPKQLERIAAEARAEGHDVFPGHSPIPMVPALTYMMRRYRAAKTLSASDDTDFKRQREREELRKLKIRNDRQEGAYVHDANAQANAGLAEVVKATKARLLWAEPDRLYDACRTDMHLRRRRDAVPDIREVIKQALTDMATRAGALDDLDAYPDADASAQASTTTTPAHTRRQRRPSPALKRHKRRALKRTTTNHRKEQHD